MRPVISLPGLERLLQVCRVHSMELYQEPPCSRAPVAGEPVEGLPCDPLLAAVYARVNALGLPDDFFVFSLNAEDGFDLADQNKAWRQDWPAPFEDLLVFAKEQALAYCYATVPTLADAQGVQPVVWVDTYEDLYALPIASSVDRFFDAYSYSLERQVALIRQHAESNARFEAEFGPPPPGSLSELLARDTPRINFPWEVPDLIARDEPLVKLLRAGRFDFLMEGCEEAHAWVGKVLAAASP
jgi:hypothetical protein